MKSNWIGIGFSHHIVPLLSNTATRSAPPLDLRNPLRRPVDGDHAWVDEPWATIRREGKRCYPT
jgi:hypothetical protein